MCWFALIMVSDLLKQLQLEDYLIIFIIVHIYFQDAINFHDNWISEWRVDLINNMSFKILMGYLTAIILARMWDCLALFCFLNDWRFIFHVFLFESSYTSGLHSTVKGALVSRYLMTMYLQSDSTTSGAFAQSPEENFSIFSTEGLTNFEAKDFRIWCDDQRSNLPWSRGSPRMQDFQCQICDRRRSVTFSVN